MIDVGLPTAPLPDRWWRGLSRRRIHRIVHCELHGQPRVLPSLHEKGYVRLYLGRGHPYADRNGCCYLHRWLVQRREGRRLASYEHVHHEDDDKVTTDHTKLKILEAIEHAHFHYGRWISCGEEHTAEELESMAAEYAARFDGGEYDADE